MTDTSVDPDVWIISLEEIKGDLKNAGAEISDLDLMMHILSYLPSEYAVTVEMAEVRLGNESNPLSLEKLRELLNNKFQWKSAEKTFKVGTTALLWWPNKAEKGSKEYVITVASMATKEQIVEPIQLEMAS